MKDTISEIEKMQFDLMINITPNQRTYGEHLPSDFLIKDDFLRGER